MQRDSCGSNRENPVGGTVEDQRGHIDARQVTAEVGQPRRDAIGECLGGGNGCDVPTGPHDISTDPVTTEDIDVVEISQER